MHLQGLHFDGKFLVPLLIVLVWLFGCELADQIRETRKLWKRRK